MLRSIYRSSRSITPHKGLFYRALSTSRQVRQEHEKPFYVTTPIFYPNAVPHIGHLYTIVTGDIIARHAELTRPNRPVHYINGTDEHGFKIQKAAQAAGVEPIKFCDTVTEHFRTLATKANIKHTRFIRTTEACHHEAVQHVWRVLDEKGLIYKGTHKGWYSVSDECFYTDSQVTRIESPLGTSVVSTETGSSVEWMEEENYKFRLSAFRDALLARYQADDSLIYPSYQHSYVLDMLSAPLEDLSISRPRSRLHWGIPVPNDPDHTMYVWFDALTVYLTATGYPWTESLDVKPKSFWPPNLQIVGKDIVRFHAIYFPAMLLALDLPLPMRLLAHGHWTVKKLKMSKSVGNVADPIQAMDDFGVDVVRYYMARIGGRFKDDTEWSFEQLEKYLSELQSTLGNVFLRINSPAIRKRLPEDFSQNSYLQASDDTPELRDLVATLKHLATVVDNHLQQLQVADGLEAIVLQLQAVNKMLTDVEPWRADTPDETVAKVYAVSSEALRISAILLQPFIPSKAATLLDALGIDASARTWAHAQFGTGTVGEVKRVVLFPRRKSGAHDTPKL